MAHSYYKWLPEFFLAAEVAVMCLVQLRIVVCFLCCVVLECENVGSIGETLVDFVEV